MRTSSTPNATPQSTPPSGAGPRGGVDSQAGIEEYIWTSLVPRLVHPTKLAIVKALLEAGRPLSLDDFMPLLPAMDGNRELVKYHATSMVEAGALEVASTQIRAADEVPYFSFRQPE